MTAEHAGNGGIIGRGQARRREPHAQQRPRGLRLQGLHGGRNGLLPGLARTAAGGREQLLPHRPRSRVDQHAFDARAA